MPTALAIVNILILQIFAVFGIVLTVGGAGRESRLCHFNNHKVALKPTSDLFLIAQGVTHSDQAGIYRFKQGQGKNQHKLVLTRQQR